VTISSLEERLLQLEDESTDIANALDDQGFAEAAERLRGAREVLNSVRDLLGPEMSDA